ncbi:hypothetical protein ACEYYA_01025 [Paracoccus sp. p3-h83]|uniref:hypothetical protein n=1 Tax=Paracoccus sp. p3-h83 TaxID=3342805 RepID=UPI0035B8B9F0
MRRPEVVERRRAAAQARRIEQRRTATPEEIAEKRETTRAYYRANRDSIRAYFRDWLAAMPPDRRQQWDAAQRDAQARYKRRRALAQMLKQSRMILDRTPKHDL